MSLFKNDFDILGPTVKKVCNHSLVDGVFPNRLKKAEVTPIFKADNKSNINNFRPIVKSWKKLFMLK